MEQLTLTDAAVNHHNEVYGMPKDFKPIELTERQHANNIHAAFKAGAEWQKEQLKKKALQLVGADVWIADVVVKAMFQKYLRELLQD